MPGVHYTPQGTPKSCARYSLHFLTPLSAALAYELIFKKGNKIKDAKK
jgi:hypothetical protein